MSKSKNQTTETSSVTTAVPSFDQNQIGQLATTSAKIRYLDSCGLTRGQISKTLNIRYQWVRNVLITPLKKQS